MPHLRAPAVRADRRDDTGHGGPGGTALPLPEPHIRAQLLRIAVLPAVAVALSATAAVLFTVRASTTPTGITLWAVLAGALSVALTGIVIAAVAARRAARALGDRLGALRRTSIEGREAVRELVAALDRGEVTPEPPPLTDAPDPEATSADDEFTRLARELAHARATSERAVHHAAHLSGRAGSEQKVEVFVNLARRLQSLVHREITILDDLENEVEDPELLKGLFHVDHLATRIRRHAENLAVLGGAVSRRQWTTPVSLHEVMRSAVAEVEQYARVRLVPPLDGTLRGHAVADVVHLMAELVENATVFSAPHTQVLLRVAPVASGIAIEVEDRGLGMPVEEQARMNDLLSAPDQLKVASLLQDGRIGLLVVSQLAHRHGIVVRLQSNIYGGTQAVLVLPQDLLGAGGGTPAPSLPSGTGGTTVPTGRPSSPGALRPGSRAVVPVPPPGTGGAAPRPPRGGSGSLPVRDSRSRPRIPAGPAPDGHATRSRPVPGDPAALPPAPAPGGAPRPRGDDFAEERPTRRLGSRTAPAPAPDRPHLPRRRAQEHLVPQLRQAPSRPAPGPSAEADPGLMAAFQRGVDLAEAQHAQRVQDEARLPAARAVPQARHTSAPAPAAGRPQPPTARDHPPVDHASPTKPAVLTALDVPAHELPALTRTPIHDLALSAFTAAQSAAPPAAAGTPRPAPDQGPPPPGR
ncbi:ATP-binding protein [Streptomyces sp. LE64]|uniref:ATP-binding protein n=1 Tax=Streptomyces sp. LE64 TaxID=3448653 RepID=UPI00404175D0